MKMKKISVVGLGYIGLPTAIVLASHGYEVTGYDVNENVVNSLNSGNIHIVEKGLQEAFDAVLKSGNFRAFTHLQEAEAYLIAVPTPFKKNASSKMADMSFVDRAAAAIGKQLKKGDLVVLESTVPPGSTRRLVQMLCESSRLNAEDFYTVHCPERVLPGNILYELEHNNRIIGSDNLEASLKAKELYSSFIQVEHLYITDELTAEMSKLVENAFRDVNIAFANELSVMCDELGIDVHELISIANKHPRVNILSPGVGVGGHCIAVDPWFLVERFQDKAPLIHTARKVNDQKTAFVCHKIMTTINFDTRKVIGILGLAFKPNIDDLRESPSVKLSKMLQEQGYRVIACEPNIQKSNVQGIPLYSLEEILDKSDLPVLTLSHDSFINQMDTIKQAGTLII